MNKDDITFLTEEQIYGENRLKIFEFDHIHAEISDFAILLGGITELPFDDSTTFSYNKGYYWTKTITEINTHRIKIINGYDATYDDYSWLRFYGSRVVLPYLSIKSFTENDHSLENGVISVNFGMYPQMAASNVISSILENEFSKGKLKIVGKYTTDSISTEDEDSFFKAKEHYVYEYNGNRYVRVVGDVGTVGSTLSNSSTVLAKTGYWIKVEPITWLVDVKADVAISERILFSGIQFAHYDTSIESFEETDIKMFMKNYFLPDIISDLKIPLTIKVEEVKEEVKETRVKRPTLKKNPYNLDFTEVSEEDIIKGAIESGVAVFLHGPSSEGKSARVKQIDPNCEIIYLRNATPESLNGKSVYNQSTGEMMDVPPTWLKKLQEKCEKEPDRLHVVFFDEITNALPSIQGIAFNIVLDREVNGIWKLPDNARIVAAGNDMKDSLAANQLAEPLFNRFAHVYIKTTISSWLKWASENNIHPAIYAYIAFKGEKALRSEYNGEKPNADPRKWEMASKMLYKAGNPEMLRSLVGKDITKEFAVFCNQKVITLEDVLDDNYTIDDMHSLNTAKKYAIIIGLTQVDEDNLIKVRDFIMSVLGEEYCTLFDLQWCHGDERRLELIAEAKLTRGKVKVIK